VPVNPRLLRARVAAVKRDLEPGDHIVAEIEGHAGPVPRWENPAIYASCAVAAFGVFVFIALLITGKPIHPGIFWLCAAPIQVVSLWQRVGRRPALW
jgi:hypothetical protein